MCADPKIDVFKTKHDKFFCWVSWVSSEAVARDGRMRLRTKNCDSRQEALQAAEAVAGIVEG